MTRTLITFLGRVPKAERGRYRTTRYDFGEGSATEPLAFFGWALQRRLRPDRMVVLGTTGSMWDHLFEGDLDLGAEDEDARLVLTEAVEGKEVEQSQLEALAPALSRRLGCEMALRIIPYCRDRDEQVELLRVLADEVAPGAEVHLDVTHGLRHQPMLGLLAALHLRRVRGARIGNLWYGAYDPDTQEAPVMHLGGLLHIADWLSALSIYDHVGDYGVFSAVIGGEIGRMLEEAYFLESVNRIGQARSRLRKVLDKLGAATAGPAFDLFREELVRRIGWAAGDNFYLRQRELCFEYLDRGRYRPAILTGWEAFTSLLQREAGGNLDPDNHDHREQVRKHFEGEEREKRPRPRWEAFDSLRRLRNAVAHGSQPKGGEVQRALSSPGEMDQLLRSLFETLLPEEASGA